MMDSHRGLNIVELALEENLLDNTVICWVKIEDESRTGWVRGETWDPYSNGLGSVNEIINSGDRTWTAIRLNEPGVVFARNRSTLHDKPGFTGSNVVFRFITNARENTNQFYDEMGVTILAMTRETETTENTTIPSDYRTGAWFNIRTNDGVEGWIFRGNLIQGDIGGPMFRPPEIRVSFMFIGL